MEDRFMPLSIKDEDRPRAPAPVTTLESKKRVAFLMGCASHGLQDAIFDSLFLRQVEEEWMTLMFFADFRGKDRGREVNVPQV